MWNISCKKKERTELQIGKVTCSNEDIMKRINFVHILLLNLRRSYPNLWGITAASWHRHHHFKRQDPKPFRHLSSCDRLSEFYPWVAAVGNRVVKHHLSPDLLALKRCSLNWRGQIGEKKQSLRENNLSFSIHFDRHFSFFHVQFSFFPCGSPEWSTSAISPRSQLTEPLATRLEEVTPSTNKPNRQTRVSAGFLTHFQRMQGNLGNFICYHPR